ncbi:hypothetical protein GCM10027037_06480 [Mucilaginibacter koreensis]
MPVSIGVYTTLALFENKVGRLKAAVIYTALLGLFDATVGWKISQLLQANTGAVNNHPSAAVWAATVIFVMLYGALLSLLTAGIYNFLSKRKSTLNIK